ncbi:uncharacterized protein LOC135696544 isoform X2 [Rhopilema esculentum]
MKSAENPVTDEKMAISFKTLDGIIPKLGMFQKVVKALRDDIFEGVYSREYTVTNKQTGKSQSIQRIPYFTLLFRIHEQRNEKAEELLANIRKLEERCMDFESLISEKEAQISLRIEAEEKLKQKISALQLELRSEKDEVKKSQGTIEKLKNDKKCMEESNEKKISDLKIELDSCVEESKNLRVYKTGYDKLKDTFENPHLTLKESDTGSIKSSQSKEITAGYRYDQIKKDLSVMETLEEQLYMVRNCVIQEYDDFMENNKKQYELPDDSSAFLKELRSFKDDNEIERESQELVRTQKAFANTMVDINEEVKLLLQNQQALQAELSRIEKNESNRVEAKKKYKEENSSADNSASLEELDLVEIMTGNTEDPFVPHENILNKYSCMIYTSCNEGKTFYEIPETRVCDGCGVKTLICPHAVTDRERIFSLPKNCTHIKVVRPRIKISRKMRRKKSQAKKLTVSENNVLPRLKFIWEDYYLRTSVERKVYRSLTEEYILSIVNQFYALMIWQDEYQPMEENPISILESFYKFLQDRFILEDVIFIVFYDILTAVGKYAATNKQIHLFAACLDGTVDAAVFRYVLLMAEFISSFEWIQMQDFSSFAAIVYPFLQEDDFEQLRMGYTSFSENKVSSGLVFQYLLYVILNGREPRFMEFEVKLLQCPVRKPGYFTDIEFVEALDSLVPLASERLLHRLFSQAVRHFPGDDETIHVSRVSHLTSYLALIHNTPRIRNAIKQWKMDNKKLVSEQQDNEQRWRFKQPKNYFGFMTLSKIKALGMEMGRRARARKAQEEQEKLADYITDSFAEGASTPEIV